MFSVGEMGKEEGRMFQARRGKMGHCGKAGAGEGVRLSDAWEHRVYGEV